MLVLMSPAAKSNDGNKDDDDDDNGVESEDMFNMKMKMAICADGGVDCTSAVSNNGDKDNDNDEVTCVMKMVICGDGVDGTCCEQYIMEAKMMMSV